MGQPALAEGRAKKEEKNKGDPIRLGYYYYSPEFIGPNHGDRANPIQSTQSWPGREKNVPRLLAHSIFLLFLVLASSLSPSLAPSSAWLAVIDQAGINLSNRASSSSSSSLLSREVGKAPIISLAGMAWDGALTLGAKTDSSGAAE